MALDPFQIAGLLLFACHIVIAIKAFQDEVFQGALCLLVPFYVVYYGLRRLNLPGRGVFVLIYLASSGVYLWGIVRPGGPDVCQMLSQAEAEEFLGGPVGEPGRRSLSFGGNAAGTCEYASTAPPSRHVTVLYGDGCTELPAEARRMTRSLGLRDVADEAYTGRDQLLARTGDRCIAILTRGLPDGFEGTFARDQLAKKIIARMPK